VSPAAVVFSAVPTLFSSDGEVDTGANRALYKHLAGLLDGLFVAGTTGEFPALDDAERLSLIELALAEAGPDRVIAHIGTPDARHSARLARAAAALGATRLAAITPYYLPARPDEVSDHYRRIRDAAASAELYAYIFPERTGLRVPPPLFAAVAEAAGLAGGKLSGSAAGELAGYVAAAPGLRMFSGDDSNPAATMRAGGAGVISGRSSAYPEVYAALVAALGSDDSGDSGDSRDSRDEEAVVRHQLALDRIVGLGASIGRLKHALALRGLGGTTARMTVDPPDASLSAAIAAEVAALLFRSAVNQGPGSRVQYSEVRRKRGAGPQIGSVIVRVPGSRPGESGAPDMWPV
jgi:4-hydroxy-tetrahydrodipicolinate synthase